MTETDINIINLREYENYLKSTINQSTNPPSKIKMSLETRNQVTSLKNHFKDFLKKCDEQLLKFETLLEKGAKKFL